jgi:autophagy-related protein 17
MLKNLASSMPEGVDIRLSTSGPLTPTTEEERAAMLSVIGKDANEVEDVVLEIQDRLGEMETTYGRVMDHTRHLADTQQTAIETFHQLEAIQSKLPSYAEQSQQFLTAWELQASEISTHYENLLEMRVFYAGFLKAYHGLVVEVKRRRNCESRMESIMKDAMAKIERLYQEDVDERQNFRSGNAFYLPADIWPGLEEPPMRFAVRKQTLSTGRSSTAKD